MPPSIWPSSACGFIALPDLLRRGELDHADEAELAVDVDDGAVGGERELQVRVALAVLVEREGLAVVPLDRLLDDASPRIRAARRARRSDAGSLPRRSAASASSLSRTASHAAFTAPPVT